MPKYREYLVNKKILIPRSTLYYNRKINSKVISKPIDEITLTQNAISENVSATIEKDVINNSNTETNSFNSTEDCNTSSDTVS